MEKKEATSQDPFIPLGSNPPVRVLVQTITNLVPGHDGWAKEKYMYNIICQYHWGSEYEPGRDDFRENSAGANFAYNNRRCFFLMDHGEAENQDDVPVLSYEWTGDSLKPLPQLVNDPKVQKKLKNVPFTYEKPPPGPVERPPYRETIKKRLRKAQMLPDHELKYMKEHPEDMEWLKNNVRTRLWQTFVDDVNAMTHPDEPRMEY